MRLFPLWVFLVWLVSAMACGDPALASEAYVEAEILDRTDTPEVQSARKDPKYEKLRWPIFLKFHNSLNLDVAVIYSPFDIVLVNPLTKEEHLPNAMESGGEHPGFIMGAKSEKILLLDLAESFRLNFPPGQKWNCTFKMTFLPLTGKEVSPADAKEMLVKGQVVIPGGGD